MPDAPEFSPDEEERIRRTQQAFQDVVEEHKKRHPNSPLGINPGSDPIAREALIRLMEKNIEQALASPPEKAPDAGALQKIRVEVRERVNSL